MYDDTEGRRRRYVIPGELLWPKLNGPVQLLRQLDFSVPRFTRLAVGLVIDSQNNRMVNHAAYSRLEEFVLNEMREISMDRYYMMQGTPQLRMTVHQLIDASMAIANDLRGLLHASLSQPDRSLMVEDVISPRLDVVVSYDASDLDLQPAAALPSQDGGPGFRDAGQQGPYRRA